MHAANFRIILCACVYACIFTLCAYVHIFEDIHNEGVSMLYMHVCVHAYAKTEVYVGMCTPLAFTCTYEIHA